MRSSSFILQVWRYVFSLTVITLITAVFFLLRQVLDITLIALLYLIPLGMITAFWGLGPGIASALFSFLILNYFFIKPYYTLAVHQPTDLVILIIFLFVAVVISQLVGRMQAGLAAATARERESTQLYELSTALAGLHDDHAIVQVLTKQVQAVSQSEYVEIDISSTQTFSFHWPQINKPQGLPEIIIPIQSARNALGEIKLWKAGNFISSEGKRLLQTFATQGALALERSWLLEAESRAKVLEEIDHLKSVILS